MTTDTELRQQGRGIQFSSEDLARQAEKVEKEKQDIAERLRDEKKKARRLRKEASRLKRQAGTDAQRAALQEQARELEERAQLGERVLAGTASLPPEFQTESLRRKEALLAEARRRLGASQQGLSDAEVRRAVGLQPKSFNEGRLRERTALERSGLVGARPEREVRRFSGTRATRSLRDEVREVEDTLTGKKFQGREQPGFDPRRGGDDVFVGIRRKDGTGTIKDFRPERASVEQELAQSGRGDFQDEEGNVFKVDTRTETQKITTITDETGRRTTIAEGQFSAEPGEQLERRASGSGIVRSDVGSRDSNSVGVGDASATERALERATESFIQFAQRATGISFIAPKEVQEAQQDIAVGFVKRGSETVTQVARGAAKQAVNIVTDQSPEAGSRKLAERVTGRDAIATRFIKETKAGQNLKSSTASITPEKGRLGILSDPDVQAATAAEVGLLFVGAGGASGGAAATARTGLLRNLAKQAGSGALKAGATTVAGLATFEAGRRFGRNPTAKQAGEAVFDVSLATGLVVGTSGAAARSADDAAIAAKDALTSRRLSKKFKNAVVEGGEVETGLATTSKDVSVNLRGRPEVGRRTKTATSEQQGVKVQESQTEQVFGELSEFQGRDLLRPNDEVFILTQRRSATVETPLSSSTPGVSRRAGDSVLLRDSRRADVGEVRDLLGKKGTGEGTSVLSTSASDVPAGLQRSTVAVEESLFVPVENVGGFPARQAGARPQGTSARTAPQQKLTRDQTKIGQDTRREVEKFEGEVRFDSEGFFARDVKNLENVQFTVDGKTTDIALVTQQTELRGAPFRRGTDEALRRTSTSIFDLSQVEGSRPARVKVERVTVETKKPPRGKEVFDEATGTVQLLEQPETKTSAVTKTVTQQSESLTKQKTGASRQLEEQVLAAQQKQGIQLVEEQVQVGDLSQESVVSAIQAGQRSRSLGGSSTTASQSAQQARSALSVEQVRKQAFRQFEAQKRAQRQARSTTFGRQDVVSALAFRQRTTQRTSQRTAQETRTQQKIASSLVTRQASAQTRQTSRQTQRLRHSILTTGRTRVGSPEIPSKPDTPPPIVKIPFGTLGQRTINTVDIQVRRQGRFQTIARGVPIAKAAEVAKSKLDKTLAASAKFTSSGQVVPAGKIPGAIGQGFKKGKRDQTLLVEQNRLRISTGGEKGELASSKKGALGIKRFV